MKIEFQAPHIKVEETLIDFIRNKMIKLSHLNKEISRAEILLKEVPALKLTENKMCEITLTVFGDDIRVHNSSAHFQQSAKEVIKELTKLVKKQVALQKEPPDKTTSTIKI